MLNLFTTYNGEHGRNGMLEGESFELALPIPRRRRRGAFDTFWAMNDDDEAVTVRTRATATVQIETQIEYFSS